jgi:hypothetical protein
MDDCEQRRRRPLALDDFARRCLKPDSDRLGTWTARRWARPAALHITRVVAPLGVTAHQATLAAMFFAVAASASFAVGTPWAWLAGAILLELWYLADHVDGQLARWRGTASLDGTALDYLMHHGVHFLVPLALGYGLVQQTGRHAWFLVGIAWSAGLLACGLRHDVRYKAFVQRLKLVHGTLEVVGGGGGRPTASAWPRGFRPWLSWSLQKVTEMHALGHLLLVVAAVRLLLGDDQARIATVAVALPALSAAGVALVHVVRDLRRGEAEAQFGRWYRVPSGGSLEFSDGYWFVERDAAVAASPCDAGSEASATIRSS